MAHYAHIVAYGIIATHYFTLGGAYFALAVLHHS